MDAVKKKILLVEDEVLVALHEKQQLEKRGYSVNHVVSGEDAVLQALNEDALCDVILMDIDLGPGMDGTQAAEKILHVRDVPIVFLSSHTEPEIVEKTEKITSYGYVVKNSGMVILDASIKMALKLFNEKMERKQAEEKVLLSEENYRFQFMNMNSYNSLYEVLTDNDGRPCDFRFIMVNYAYEEYVGKKASELIGRTLLEVYPKTEQYWIDKMAEAVLTGEPVHFESFSREMNTFTEINLYIPKPGQLAMTTANISERKRAEEKFRALHQSMMDAYVSVDMDGRIIEYNESYRTLLGYTADELGALTYKDITPEQWHAFEADIVARQVMANGYSDIYEKEYRKKDGTVFPVELRTILVRDANGSPLSMWAIVRDITERKRAEAALRESEKTFRKLFEDSADAILLIDTTGVFVECNQAALSLLKMTREQFLFKPPVAISPEYQADGQRSGDKALAMIETAYEKGLHRFDWTCIDSEGDEFIVEVSLVPITIKGELMLHMTWRDITRRKSIENRLLRSEQELKKAQEIAHLGTWYLDVATNNVQWTEELYKMYGFDPSLPVPPYTEHMKLFTAESWEMLSASLQNTRETGIPYELELKTIKKDGTNGWMWVRGEAVKDDHGKIIGLWGAAQDITERKRSEEELQKSMQLITAVVEQSPVPMVIVTAHDHVVRFFNDACVRYHDVKKEDILYRRLSDIDWNWVNRTADGHRIPPDETALARALRGETTHAQIVQTTTQYGNVRWCETVGAPVYDTAGNLIAAFIVFPDITDRKAAEQEIQKQLSEKEILLREVHHRIKNNMAQIESLLSLQANSIDTPEAKTALLDSIVRVQSMRIIYDKLLLTKDYHDISFKSYVESLLDSIATVYALGKNITIEKRIMDFTIVSQKAISVGIIINELLTNVYKYAFPDRDNGWVSITVDKADTVVTLVVHDNGIGIDERLRPMESPGLGLTIVRMLVEQLKGTYRVIHDDGTKSVIELEL